MQNIFFHKQNLLNYTLEILNSKSPTVQISHKIKQTHTLLEKLLHSFKFYLSSKEEELKLLSFKLESQNPGNKIPPYSAQIVKNNKSVELSSIKKEERFFLIDTKTKIEAKRVS